jgi:DNA-binding NtrC family response regulator
LKPRGALCHRRSRRIQAAERQDIQLAQQVGYRTRRQLLPQLAVAALTRRMQDPLESGSAGRSLPQFTDSAAPSSGPPAWPVERAHLRRRQLHQSQGHGSHRKGCRVVWRDAEQQTREEARETRSHRQPDGGASRDPREALLHHHGDYAALLRRVAASEATTILLEGENGTGKDLVAKTLHYQSVRQAEPFIAINCAAIPETLLESELFGYEKGAFTDARAQKRGIFELADKGTLFLDEIGEIPLMLQAKLLRVLEEQSFRRLGGLKDIKLDLRVVAATNKNLREAVKEGAFRQDLYFRVNVIQILIPPLRERTEDIVPLTRFFIEHYNRKFKRNIEGVSDRAAELLLSHDWPGNVRELRNAIERAMILEESAQITVPSLPIAISRPDPSAPMAIPVNIDAPADGLSLEDNERSLLVRALDKTAGNQTQAARLLRITRDTLRYKMKKFNLR